MSAALGTVPISLPSPTSRWGLTYVELNPEFIGRDARELFAWKACHILASALHEETGWRLAVLEQPAGGRDGWRWIHAAVYAGHSSQLLDIDGVSEREAIASRYGMYLRYGLCRWSRPLGWAGFAAVIGLGKDCPPSWWRTCALGELAGPVIGSYVTQLVTTAREWDESQ